MASPNTRASLRTRAAAIALSTATLAGCADCNKGQSSGADASAASAASDGAAEAPTTTLVSEAGTLNATPLPTASVERAMNPDKLPPYAGPTGSVEGNITVIGDPAPATPQDFSHCPDAEKIWGHAFREGPPGPKGERPLADAIVVVTGYKGFYLPEKQEARAISIEGCGYTQRTVTMTFGQRLEIKNLANEFWSPVLEPRPSPVLMMATPNGDPVKIYPKTPGHHLLVDRDRKYVVVDVWAFLHPLHASSALTGYYRIDGLPVGKLKVQSTHPNIDANAEADLTVLAGVVHKVDLVLKNKNRDAGAGGSGAGVDAGVRGLR
ncbi:MAG: hypothetical protein JWO86_2126 [Myxococcaceae bacterium]|nr:hypothetical protein [Myxococcaceae bacterium]MEA2750599.1 hypothetical protein [Myxococcales bacterium]